MVKSLLLNVICLLALALGAAQNASAQDAAESDQPPENYILSNDGIDLVVPMAYMDPVYHYSKQQVWVYLSYPDFQVLDIENRELAEKMAAGEIIDMIVSKVPEGKERTVALSKALKSNKADHKAGDEFGLTHYQQSNAALAHLSDIWVDPAGEGSYIICNEGDKSTCTHYLYLDNFYMLIFYPKSELQHWAKIKEQSTAVYNHFKNPEH